LVRFKVLLITKIVKKTVFCAYENRCDHTQLEWQKFA
jgi:hypothetical protein